MSESCDFCGRSALEEVYEPAASALSRSIFLCTHCALAQSLPRHESDSTPAHAAAAAPGRVSSGKSFRAGAALAHLHAHANWKAPLAVLDVGADRGAFLEALLERAPAAELTAVEPDTTLVNSYRNRPRVTLVPERIERLSLPAAHFDLVHSCHTLQWTPSARAVLSGHHRALKPGGLLYVEVPNLEMIGTPDIVEEWFVDRNLFHFTPNVLVAELKALGFAIVTAPDPRDLHNASVVARKESLPAPAVRSYPREVEAVQELIASYKATRRRMRTTLKRVAAELERYGAQGVALWGAGRLLDALVTDGGFDLRHAAAVVDENLARAGLRIGGTPVQDPEVLATLKPNVVVVMSRPLSEAIRDEAKKLIPGCTVLGYADLLGGAVGEVRP
jgi:SAM-dependent methyltransferase